MCDHLLVSVVVTIIEHSYHCINSYIAVSYRITANQPGHKEKDTPSPHAKNKQKTPRPAAEQKQRHKADVK
jgi:hypothetical protein